MTGLSVGAVESDPTNVSVTVDPSGDAWPVGIDLAAGVHVSLSVSAMEALRDQLADLRRCLSCELRLATVRVGHDWLCEGCALVGEIEDATAGIQEPPAEEDL